MFEALRNMLHRAQGWNIRARTFYRKHLYPTLAPIYAVLGFISLLILVAEFGFPAPVAWEDFERRLLIALVYLLWSYEVLSFWSAPRSSFRARLRESRLQLALITIAGLFLVLGFFLRESPFESEGRLALVVLVANQVVLLFGALVHLIRRTQFMSFRTINPSLVFVLSFASVILVGFGLLLLPRMHATRIEPLDLFFTAVSAVCVTGLSTIDIARELSRPGQVVLLCLIQIGGLGLMTLTTFFAYLLTGRASVGTRMLMRDLISDPVLGRVRTIIGRVAGFTFSIELVGAAYLYWNMPAAVPGGVRERIFVSVFQSISAFCNAGFSLHSLEGPPSTLYLAGYMVLITLGGLGFPVLTELAARAWRSERRIRHFSVATRLTLLTSALLFVVASIAFFVLERHQSLRGSSLSESFVHSLFYAVTLRTAGFNTVPIGELGLTMAFLSCFFMWVGASPMSTGGGIKTSTLSLSFLHIVGQLTGKSEVEVFSRTVAESSVSRAFSTIVLSFFAIFGGIFALTLLEDAPFIDLVFEAVSAFGTVGLSRGVTSALSTPGKLVLCILMLVGRVGIMTALVALTPAARTVSYRFPREYVAVG